MGDIIVNGNIKLSYRRINCGLRPLPSYQRNGNYAVHLSLDRGNRNGVFFVLRSASLEISAQKKIKVKSVMCHCCKILLYFTGDLSNSLLLLRLSLGTKHADWRGIEKSNCIKGGPSASQSSTPS
jgi:hypothetical protein